MADTPKQSKLPNLDEISGIASKLFKDVKKSVTEIVSDYKEKRAKTAQDNAEQVATPAPEVKPTGQKTDTMQEKQDKESQ